MDCCRRIHSAYYDEHVTDPPMVLVWHSILVLWQDLQEVDQKLEGS